MTKSAPLGILLEALQPGSGTVARDEAQWDVLLRLARAADLLSRVGERARQQQWPVPARVAQHLHSARQMAGRQHRELALELREIDRVFAAADIPVVVLKGAAYVLAGLDAAAGRMVSDIDLLVPTHALPQAESALMMAGWVSANRDAYDQRYYRTWMHEIPPMQHIARGTVIDLHHNILPPTGRIKLDPDQLLAAAVPLAGYAGLRVLSPADMVLHSAAHLTHEGELDTGLRGLVDLDALVRAFAEDPAFLGHLQQRAAALKLGVPLFQALDQAQRFLATPLPPGWLDAVAAQAGISRRSVRQVFLARCWQAAVPPRHPLLAHWFAPVARASLYLRGHWLRMPLGLLVRHLSRKAVRAVLPSGEDRAST